MRDSVKIVGAALGGYVLGRRKKFKLAIGLGLYVAGKQLRLDPQKIAGMLMKQLSDSPQIAALRDQAQGQLVTVGKAAASAVVNQQASRVADALQARTEQLNAPAEESEESESQSESDEAEEPEDTDQAEETGEAEETSEAEGNGRRKSASQKSEKSGTAKRRAPAKRSGSGTSSTSRTRKTTTNRRRSSTGSEA